MKQGGLPFTLSRQSWGSLYIALAARQAGLRRSKPGEQRTPEPPHRSTHKVILAFARHFRCDFLVLEHVVVAYSSGGDASGAANRRAFSSPVRDERDCRVMAHAEALLRCTGKHSTARAMALETRRVTRTSHGCGLANTERTKPV